MSSCSVWITVASCVLGGDALVTHTDSKASMMMLVAGTTSSEEQCLIESIDQMSLGSCSAAIAAGDGTQKCDISIDACSMCSNLPLCRSGALVGAARGTVDECCEQKVRDFVGRVRFFIDV